MPRITLYGCNVLRSRRRLYGGGLLRLGILFVFAMVTGLANASAAPPRQGDPPPPLPPAFRAADPAPTLDQAPLTCNQQFADPQVDLAQSSTPWRELVARRTIVGDPVRSAPRSVLMVEDADGTPTSGDDRDGFGQTITITDDTELLYGSLYYQVAATSARTGEQLRVAIYRGTSTTDANRVGLFSVNTAAAAGWQRLDWELDDTNAISALRNSGSTTIMIELLSTSGDGANQSVWIDDLEAHVCVAALSISGRITQQSDPSADLTTARLVLAREDATGSTSILETFPSADGSYRFGGLTPLPIGSSYRVWFVNTSESPADSTGRIGFWAGPQVAAGASGEQRLADFDISDIPLSTPQSYSKAVAPLNLIWVSRQAAVDRYQVCLYDPLRLTTDGAPAQLCSSRLDPTREALRFQLTPQLLDAATDLDFSYARTYHWYVAALELDASGQVSQYGYSFFERALSLLPNPASPAPNDPNLPTAPNLPAAVATPGDWTLLVYAAADNALGDIERTPGKSRPELQLAGLSQVASRYPQVRIVTFLDRYGDTGGQICYLRPSGSPDCRTQPEPNSADPATLGGFVQTALERYPSQHRLLLLLGPGHPISGFGTDETTGGWPAMPITDLGAQLAAQAGTGQSLDLIVAQAPLLGNLDVAAALAGAADYLVAAPDQIWQVNLAERMLPLLSGINRNDPQAVARGVLNVYDGALTALGGTRARSLAVYDLAQAREARDGLDLLGDALRSDLEQNPAATLALLAQITANAQAYDSSANGLLNALRTPTGIRSVHEDALFDAGEVAQQIADSPLVRDTTRNLATNLNSLLSDNTPLVIAQIQRSGTSISGQPINLNGTGGISLLFPGPTRMGNQNTLSRIALYNGWEGEWKLFLRTYVGRQPASGAGGVTAGPAGQAYVLAPPGGRFGVDLWLPLVAQQQ